MRTAPYIKPPFVTDAAVRAASPLLQHRRSHPRFCRFEYFLNYFRFFSKKAKVPAIDTVNLDKQ
jgi:hypothetical protein